MATLNRTHSRSRSRDVLPKPAGVIHPRVQAVGPEHFGIVAIDCAKARFKWQLADFYGKILVPPTTVEHNRTDLDNALAQLRAAAARHHASAVAAAHAERDLDDRRQDDHALGAIDDLGRHVVGDAQHFAKNRGRIGNPLCLV